MRLVFGGIRVVDPNDPYTRGLPLADQLARRWAELALSPTPRWPRTPATSARARARPPWPTAPWSRRTPRRHDLLPGRSGTAAELRRGRLLRLRRHSRRGRRGRVRRVVRQRRRCRQHGRVRETIYPTLGPIIQVPGSVSTFGGNARDHRQLPDRRNGDPQRRRCLHRLLQGLPHLRERRAVEVRHHQGAQGPGLAGATHVAISPAPSGRLWIAFEDDDDNLHAVRTNTTAQEVRRRAHPRAAQVGRTRLQGRHRGHPGARRPAVQRRGEDLAPAAVRRPDVGGRTPPAGTATRPRRSTFKVTDAGESSRARRSRPSSTATSSPARTEDNGKCSITFPKMGKTKVKVAAKKSGYAPDETKLKVK